MRPKALRAPVVRQLRPGDLERVIHIDALHTGSPKPDYWKRVFREFLEPDPDRTRLGFAAEDDGRVAGYLFGEVRAFEFGSEACGWVFAVGVDPERLHARVASSLLAEACRAFKDADINCVRTMVRRNDIPVLSFFRANGFSAGPFVQLELNLGEEL